jgi:hypothetical protein
MDTATDMITAMKDTVIVTVVVVADAVVLLPKMMDTVIAMAVADAVEVVLALQTRVRDFSKKPF